MTSSKSIITTERIERAILLIRGHNVLLDADLAALYGVEIRALVQAVKRNIDRFPTDFMFQLTKAENEVLRSQFVTLEPSRGQHRKYLPYVFTEQGVAMLSSVLRSKQAIRVNIEIIRAFVHMRQLIASQRGLMQKFLAMEKKYDKQFKIVFEAIRQLMEPPQPKQKGEIGFRSTK